MLTFYPPTPAFYSVRRAGVMAESSAGGGNRVLFEGLTPVLGGDGGGSSGAAAGADGSGSGDKPDGVPTVSGSGIVVASYDAEAGGAGSGIHHHQQHPHSRGEPQLELTTTVLLDNFIVSWHGLPPLPAGLLPRLRVTFASTHAGHALPVFWFSSPGARHTILYSHGNAADLGQMRDMLYDMSMHMGVNIVAYDYSGYGAATGAPTERVVYDNISSVFRHVLDAGVSREHLTILGQSVGSGPSCYIAEHEKVHSLILVSGIMSGLRVLTPNRLLCCCDIFPNVDRLRNVTCPVFIIHGMLDETVPIHHGRGLYNAVPKELRFAPWFPSQCGHNDVYALCRQEFWQHVTSFIRSASLDNPGSALESDDEVSLTIGAR